MKPAVISLTFNEGIRATPVRRDASVFLLCYPGPGWDRLEQLPSDRAYAESSGNFPALCGASRMAYPAVESGGSFLAGALKSKIEPMAGDDGGQVDSLGHRDR